MNTPNANAVKLDVAANLTRWRTFLAVAQAGSLTRAALQLDCDVTAVSRQLNSLEVQCGVRLFERTGRGMKLSDAGAALLPQVSELLATAQELEHAVRFRGASVSGRVTVALMPSVAPDLAGKLYTFLKTNHPAVRLRIMEGASGKVEEWLADGRADIGLLYRYSDSLPEDEISLGRAHACVVSRATRPQRDVDTIPFERLAQLELVLPGRPNGLRHTIDSIARASGLPLEPAMECDSLLSLKALAIHHGLNVILGLHTVMDEVKAGLLHASRIVDPPIQPTISLLQNGTKSPGKAVAIAAERIIEIFRSSAAPGLLSVPLSE